LTKQKFLCACSPQILARQQAAVEPPDSEPVATEPTVSAKKQPKSRQKAGSDEEDEDDADEQVKHSSKRQKRGEKQPAKTSGRFRRGQTAWRSPIENVQAASHSHHHVALIIVRMAHTGKLCHA
jgi:hypothetical protein